jgi:hypothetical protein
MDMHKQFLIEKVKVQTQQYSNLLIFFKSTFARTLVLDRYSLNQLKKIKHGCRQLMSETGVNKEGWELPIYVIKVPDVNEIKWENAG